METVLDLVRHGQTEWNMEQRIQGHLDSPLTPVGIQQAKETAHKLRDVSYQRIYVSSSQRALQTALLLRGERDIDLMQTDAVREIHLGIWEGQTWPVIEEKYPQELELMRSHPEQFDSRVTGGESFSDVQKRVRSFVHLLLVKHAGERILLVSHAITMKVLIATVQGKPLHSLWKGSPISWASVTTLRFSDSSVQVSYETKNRPHV